ncbi:caltractin [Plakobranchus ocellatus]|uniref:Caltractin n=1 Tax=Plakobranchus ocellatus TaxID=259542 RepID=A0AAV4AW82_9GAST|nr:caltractin [Plakobranchus ocellatus]
MSTCMAFEYLMYCLQELYRLSVVNSTKSALDKTQTVQNDLNVDIRSFLFCIKHVLDEIISGFHALHQRKEIWACFHRVWCGPHHTDCGKRKTSHAPVLLKWQVDFVAAHVAHVEFKINLPQTYTKQKSMTEKKEKKTASFKSQPELQEYASEENDETVDEEAKKRRDILRKELASMATREENAKARWREKREKERRKAVAKMHKERVEKGISILPGSDESKISIRKVMKDEETIALKSKIEKLQFENKKIQSYIDHKLGISALPRGEELLALAEDFYSNEHVPNEQLPEKIRRALTSEEIQDLRRVFELFDAKSKGYIIAQDLKRAAAMLGFTAKRKVFHEMIDDIPSSRKGRVTFVAFLEFVIKIQGDGADPYDEMKQFFMLLDRDDKGFVTFKDLRHAADELKIPLSNNAIRDMMSEADPLGHGKIRLEDIVSVLGQSGTFRSLMPAT